MFGVSARPNFCFQSRVSRESSETRRCTEDGATVHIDGVTSSPFPVGDLGRHDRVTARFIYGPVASFLSPYSNRFYSSYLHTHAQYGCVCVYFISLATFGLNSAGTPCLKTVYNAIDFPGDYQRFAPVAADYCRSIKKYET